MNRTLTSCLLLGVSGWLAGCDLGSGQSRAFGNREISWQDASPGHPQVAGIDQAEVDFGIWGDGAALVIWSDAGCQLGASGMGNRDLEPGESRNGVKYEGNVTSKDGESWKVACMTPDGKSGTVKISEQTFNLASGGLFLVSTKGANPRVKQLKLGKLDLKPEGSRTVDQMTMVSLQKFGKTDPDIQGFFSEAARSP